MANANSHACAVRRHSTPREARPANQATAAREQARLPASTPRQPRRNDGDRRSVYGHATRRPHGAADATPQAHDSATGARASRGAHPPRGPHASRAWRNRAQRFGQFSVFDENIWLVIVADRMGSHGPRAGRCRSWIRSPRRVGCPRRRRAGAAGDGCQSTRCSGQHQARRSRRPRRLRTPSIRRRTFTHTMYSRPCRRARIATAGRRSARPASASPPRQCSGPPRPIRPCGIRSPLHGRFAGSPGGSADGEGADRDRPRRQAADSFRQNPASLSLGEPRGAIPRRALYPWRSI